VVDEMERLPRREPDGFAPLDIPCPLRSDLHRPGRGRLLSAPAGDKRAGCEPQQADGPLTPGQSQPAAALHVRHGLQSARSPRRAPRVF
jgi:hypothetical protein